MSNLDRPVPATEPAEVDPVTNTDVDGNDIDAPADPAFKTPAVGSGLTPEALQAEVDTDDDTRS